MFLSGSRENKHRHGKVRKSGASCPDWTFLKKYNMDYDLVDNHIIKRKKEMKLYKEDPNCPDREEWWLYYAMDHEEVIDSHAFEIEQGMRIEANIDPSAVAGLVSPQIGMFADTAAPLRSGHSASFWKDSMPDLLPGTEPAALCPKPKSCPPALPDAPDAPISSPPDAPKSSPAGDLLGMLRNAGVDIAQLRQPDGGKIAVKAAAKAKAAKGKAKAKAKVALPQSPLDRGCALRSATLTDSAQCAGKRKELLAVDGCKSLCDELMQHETGFDTIFSECQALIKEDCNDESVWNPIALKAEALKKLVTKTLGLAAAVTKHIAAEHKRVTASKEKAA